METIREKRKPVFIEAKVSRLYGHSSASGANYVQGETCCIKEFESHLKREKVLNEKQIKEIWDNYKEEVKTAQQEVMKETDPKADSIWNHVYHNGESADWRKF